MIQLIFFSANHYQKIWSLPSNQFLKCMTNLDVSPIWKATLIPAAEEICCLELYGFFT